MSKDPIEALDDFLEALRREFHGNPDLAYRIVNALGGDIELRGAAAASVLNPMTLVNQKGADGARETLLSFSLADLKKIAKSQNLASSIDLKGKDVPTLVDMIVRRAANKIADRQS
ncbi:MAG: hypothetical protein AAGA89_00335 [Pseudomonadota bacterium]